MHEIDFIREELRRSIHGDAWHGPAVLEALAGLTPADAAARPIEGAHSAWELALHILAWIEEVTRRLGGAPPGLPARGDWPVMGEPGADAWRELQGEIAAALATLDRALAAMPAARLDREVGRAHDAEPGADGTTYARMLHGLAQHHAYHAGQLLLLRRALGIAS